MAAIAPAGQALPAVAMAPLGGQVDAGSWEAYMADMEQSAMSTTSIMTTKGMEPPAAQVVASTAEQMWQQTEVDTSTTCSVGVAKPDVTPPTQMEVEVPMMDRPWLGVTATSQEEMARPVTSSA
jgi:hypothetical protein